MSDVFRQTLKHEGYGGFYKGLLPNLLKVVPAASITYLVYERMKKWLELDQASRCIHEMVLWLEDIDEKDQYPKKEKEKKEKKRKQKERERERRNHSWQMPIC